MASVHRCLNLMKNTLATIAVAIIAGVSLRLIVAQKAANADVPSNANTV